MKTKIISRIVAGVFIVLMLCVSGTNYAGNASSNEHSQQNEAVQSSEQRQIAFNDQFARNNELTNTESIVAVVR